jgi:hypothetical protein
VKNTGNCTWDNGYVVAFVGGTAFAQGAAPIPNAAPGQIVDISLAMVAPTNFGNYTGIWRLRASNGAFFGTNLTVLIAIPNPNPPTATKTLTPSPTATHTPPACSGAPTIASFGASPNPIIKGSSTTLSWGAVTNATSAVIDNGIGPIATPGSIAVSPGSTTTYTLTATCASSGASATAQVTLTVVGNFAGHWLHNFGFMDLTQSGVSVTGTYHNSFDGGNGTLAGTVSGNTLTGTYQKINTGNIQFVLGGNGSTFTGNWNGVNLWCGARSGVSFPSGCSFDGAWTNHVAGNSNCAMTLNRINMSVTGTYCNSSVSGTISYTGSSSETILTGNYDSCVCPFKFYLLGYNALQFQGNWGPTQTTHYWCGWRSSSSEPSPCYR